MGLGPVAVRFKSPVDDQSVLALLVIGLPTSPSDRGPLAWPGAMTKF